MISFCLLLVLFLKACASNGKPVILVQPSDTVIIGFSFTLMCISNSQNNTVTWFHNNKIIQFHRQQDMMKTADGSLFVSNALVYRDEGFYQCLVSNTRGSVFSRRAKVKFPYLKQFAKGNEFIRKEESHSVVLKCIAPDSYPDRQIQWSKIDPQNRSLRKPLPQSPYYTVSSKGDLHFSYVKSGDSGDYVCTVTNNVINRHVVRTLVLTVYPVLPLVNQPPMISPEFSLTKVAMKGEQFALECIAYGMPVPKITLRKKGLHMIIGRIAGNARRHFIKSFRSNDAGRYRCKATDPSGRSDSRTTTVRMEAKPEWVKKPSDVIVGNNSTISLPCEAVGIPRVHYQWYFNGFALKPSAKHSFSGGNLTLSRLAYSDTGMYQCVVTNRHGQMISSAEVMVAEIPAGFGPGSKAPEDINKLIRSTVTLPCNPTGNPKPTVRWRKGSTYLRKNPRYLFMANGNLRIFNLTRYDSGRYTCEVSNRLGSNSRTARLNVQENLAITTLPKDQMAKIGSNVRFTCGVSTMGVTEVTIQWSRYYQPVIPNSRITIGKSGQGMSYININRVRFSDAGLYSCTVSTPLGSVSSKSSIEHAILQVQGPPDPPKHVKVSNINSRYNVNITWSLGRDNYSPITKVIIEQKVYFYPRVWSLVKTITDPKETRVEVTMSPWARYTFRAIAVNAIGSSRPSAETATIITPPNAPDIPPQGIKSKGKTPSTFQISWQRLTLMQQNGPDPFYVVYYKKADSKESMKRHEVRNNRTRFTIKGTTYYTKYAFQVQAANKRGFGPKSVVQYGYSGERYPVGRPTKLKITITSPTSAIATWTPVLNKRDITGGKLLGYKVYFWTDDFDYRPRKAKFKSTVRATAMLQLDAFTSYRFQVLAYNSLGDGPGSSIVGPLRTPMGSSITDSKSAKRHSEINSKVAHLLPEPPSHLTLAVQNASYVLLQWAPPKTSNGAIMGYTVSVRRLVDSKTVSKTTNFSTELRVYNLDLKTRFQFSVRAKNTIGEGPPVMADFDLATISLSWPDNVQAFYDAFQREATISWDKIRKLRVDGYRIYYYKKEGKLATIDVERDRTEWTIPRLENGNDFWFQIAAFSLVDGEHYMIGPRSPAVKAGKVVVSARKSSGSNISSQLSLLHPICVFILFYQLVS